MKEGAIEMNTAEGHWSAEDWFGGTTDWVDLCADAQIDPEFCLRDDWESVVAKVVAHERETADQIVSGVEEYVRQAAVQYRREFGEGGGEP